MSLHIVIIGTGLIGGSMGLAIRAADPSMIVTGVDSPDVLDFALSRGAISKAEPDALKAVVDADVVIIATPPNVALTILEQIAPYVPSGAVVTDMSSVKRPISQVADEFLSKEVLFVGGHPMTGSEKSGIKHANALLFENATYVLCPRDLSKIRDSDQYQRLSYVIGLSGARIVVLTAEKHDRIAACVSHIPQLLSVILVNLAGKARQRDPEVLMLAAGGFRDMTRIASSPFQLWGDILENNEDEILEALNSLQGQVERVKEILISGDLTPMRQLFQDAEQTRDFIPTDRKGFLKPLADVYVFTVDRPGALVNITTCLFEAALNIKDIELLRIREGTGGTFRLGFDSLGEARLAVDILSESGFSSYQL
ncbi:MAG: prephenate dehydrogenase [Bacteroidetes bacterium]|nr:prephenate dehydrogenase [Bacteroidota bacterium]